VIVLYVAATLHLIQTAYHPRICISPWCWCHSLQ